MRHCDECVLSRHKSHRLWVSTKRNMFSRLVAAYFWIYDVLMTTNILCHYYMLLDDISHCDECVLSCQSRLDYNVFWSVSTKLPCDYLQYTSDYHITLTIYVRLCDSCVSHVCKCVLWHCDECVVSFWRRVAATTTVPRLWRPRWHRGVTNLNWVKVLRHISTDITDSISHHRSCKHYSDRQQTLSYISTDNRCGRLCSTYTRYALRHDT